MTNEIYKSINQVNKWKNLIKSEKKFVIWTVNQII